MQIHIVSDAICPWCYIGKRRLEAALAERPDLTPTIRWQPFELNPDFLAEGMDRQTYLAQKFGGADGAARAYAPVRAAGAEVGIPFDFDNVARVPNTIKAHCLIHWAEAAGVQDAMVEGLFRAYFIDGLDIGADDVLSRVAASAGLDGDEVAQKLAAGEDQNLMRVRAQKVREQGISGVPCFIFDRKYAVVGAQEPAAFLQVFDQLETESA